MVAAAVAAVVVLVIAGIIRFAWRLIRDYWHQPAARQRAAEIRRHRLGSRTVDICDKAKSLAALARREPAWSSWVQMGMSPDPTRYSGAIYNLKDDGDPWLAASSLWGSLEELLSEWREHAHVLGKGESHFVVAVELLCEEACRWRDTVAGLSDHYGLSEWAIPANADTDSLMKKKARLVQLAVNIFLDKAVTTQQAISRGIVS